MSRRRIEPRADLRDLAARAVARDQRAEMTRIARDASTPEAPIVTVALPEGPDPFRNLRPRKGHKRGDDGPGRPLIPRPAAWKNARVKREAQ